MPKFGLRSGNRKSTMETDDHVIVPMLPVEDFTEEVEKRFLERLEHLTEKALLLMGKSNPTYVEVNKVWTVANWYQGWTKKWLKVSEKFPERHACELRAAKLQRCGENLRRYAEWYREVRNKITTILPMKQYRKHIKNPENFNGNLESMINDSDHLRSAYNGRILDPSLGAETEDSSNTMFSKTSSDESNVAERRSRRLPKAFPQRIKTPGPKLTNPEKLAEEEEDQSINPRMFDDTLNPPSSHDETTNAQDVTVIPLPTSSNTSSSNTTPRAKGSTDGTKASTSTSTEDLFEPVPGTSAEARAADQIARGASPRSRVQDGGFQLNWSRRTPEARRAPEGISQSGSTAEASFENNSRSIVRDGDQEVDRSRIESMRGGNGFTESNVRGGDRIQNTGSNLRNGGGSQANVSNSRRRNGITESYVRGGNSGDERSQSRGGGNSDYEFNRRRQRVDALQHPPRVFNPVERVDNYHNYPSGNEAYFSSTQDDSDYSRRSSRREGYRNHTRRNDRGVQFREPLGHPMPMRSREVTTSHRMQRDPIPILQSREDYGEWNHTGIRRTDGGENPARGGRGEPNPPPQDNDGDRRGSDAPRRRENGGRGSRDNAPSQWRRRRRSWRRSGGRTSRRQP